MTHIGNIVFFASRVWLIYGTLFFSKNVNLFGRKARQELGSLAANITIQYDPYTKENEWFNNFYNK